MHRSRRTAQLPHFTSLADRVNQLARRAARLNDQAEVTNLQDTYGYAVDRKLWDQAAGLFANDGTMELGLQGVYVGKASIRRGLDQFGPQGLRDGELNDHVYLETLVSVAPDGRTANARGVELIMSSAPAGRRAERGRLREHVRQAGQHLEDSVRALLPAHDRRCRGRLGQEREARARSQQGVSSGPPADRFV